LCPTYPLYIGLYGIQKFTFAKLEAKSTLEYNFVDERFRMHDPEKMVSSHVAHIKICYPYTHQEWEEEEVNKRAQYFNEVQD